MPGPGHDEAVESDAAQARRAIHDNAPERLQQLLTECPALLSWQGGDDGAGLLGFATSAFGDSFAPESEQWFTRAACAELLIDAGVVVAPTVYDGILQSRARGLLHLFYQKGLLPHTLIFAAARGDLEAIRSVLAERPSDLDALNRGFICACRFEHEQAALLLLDACMRLDTELRTRISAKTDRQSFVKSVIEKRSPDFQQALAAGPWMAFVTGRVSRALHDGDLPGFVRELQDEPWLLGDDLVWFQVELIETAALLGRESFISALLAAAPGVLRRQPPPASQAIEIAVTYGHTSVMPLLTRLWPLPDDLPYAAAMGDLERVVSWFDESGAAALGDLDRHYPANDARARAHLHWNPPTAQQVLDVALAFAVINRHFAVADFLLAHGADIDTTWNSHEPASLLHHLVFENNYDAMRFLIDRGIDMTITDYRWSSTATGWARHGKKDEAMAQWLEEAERQRQLPAG